MNHPIFEAVNLSNLAVWNTFHYEVIALNFWAEKQSLPTPISSGRDTAFIL
jgi:hypothetical protein